MILQTIQKLNINLNRFILTFSFSRRQVTQGKTKTKTPKPTTTKIKQPQQNNSNNTIPKFLAGLFQSHWCTLTPYQTKCPMPCAATLMSNWVRIFQDISAEHEANRRSRCISQLLTASVWKWFGCCAIRHCSVPGPSFTRREHPPCEGSGWSCMDRHIRWAQPLLCLWFSPSRRKNSQKSQMLQTSFPKRKRNNLNVVSQSQKT